jgi:hypothetical protein
LLFNIEYCADDVQYSHPLLKNVRFEIDNIKLNTLFAKPRKLEKDTCSKLGETKFSEFINYPSSTPKQTTPLF